jgi:hypothetical protein
MTETQQPPAEQDPGGLLEEWLSRAALGEQLGVSVDTLARWETRRIGPPCVRVGRKVIYRIEAVREWLVRQEARTSGGRK